jgi:hypothetical protein
MHRGVVINIQQLVYWRKQFLDLQCLLIPKIETHPSRIISSYQSDIISVSTSLKFQSAFASWLKPPPEYF